MESDPIISLLTTGGTGLSGGALTYYLLTKLNGKNGNGDAAAEMKTVAAKLDHTNELLIEMSRSQSELLNDLSRSLARLEGILSNQAHRG